MKVLAIETSCDETAVAIIESTGPSFAKASAGKEKIRVLSNAISSQVKLHAKYGGVVPNLASREHVRNIEHVSRSALREAGIKNPSKELDLIAVTRGPGLGPALLVGLTFARTVAWLLKKPLIGVNHMEGHIHSNWLEPSKVKSEKEKVKKNLPSDFSKKEIFPALNVVVSGGHTELVLMKDHGIYKIIGETLDDAIGEAFDKAARLLGLGYPGGPAISKLAEQGNPEKYPLPRPMLNSKNYDFSYSGLKTAVLYLLRDMEQSEKQPARTTEVIRSGGKVKSEKVKADVAASFQAAAIDVIVIKAMRAAKEYKVKSILLSGGVSANKLLRQRLHDMASELGIHYFCPAMEYTTDNAAMIAVAGYFAYQKNKKPTPPVMDANLSL